MEAYSLQCCGNGIFEPLKDRLRNHFGRRCPVDKLRNVAIEVFMIVSIDDFSIDGFVDGIDGANHAGCFIIFAAYGDFEKVIVAMPGLVVAFAKQFDVLFV